jgi:hypothetical protein
MELPSQLGWTVLHFIEDEIIDPAGSNIESPFAQIHGLMGMLNITQSSIG